MFLATAQQQGYTDNSLDLFLHLLSKFPEQPFVQDLVCRLLCKLATSGKKIGALLEKGVTEVFISMIKDVRVKSILVSSAQGLATLCHSKEEGLFSLYLSNIYPARVIEEVMSSGVVPVIAALLQLNISELTVSLCSILESVCKSGRMLSMHMII